MKQYKAVLFDLDGTLTDPKIGITRSVKYALNKFSIEVENEDDLIPFIGPPLHHSFQQFYGFNEDESKKAVDYYREYYKVTGIYENGVYPGITELLKELKAYNFTLLLATSKPSIFARKILRHFDISKYLDFVIGSYLDGRRTEKEDVIKYALKKVNDIPKDRVVMVGDRKFDIIGAKKLGIDSIAVSFGYGSREELESAGPTYIADSAYELKNILI